MVSIRCFACLAFGLLLVAAGAVACSGIDPNPPDPHVTPEPLYLGILGDPSDAGADAEVEAGP